jgi:hypothetical protein
MTQKQTHVHASLIKIIRARTKSDCCQHVTRLAYNLSIYRSIIHKPRRAAFRFRRTLFWPPRAWLEVWMDDARVRRKTGCLY